jgi:hypothetical protein
MVGVTLSAGEATCVVRVLSSSHTSCHTPVATRLLGQSIGSTLGPVVASRATDHFDIPGNRVRTRQCEPRAMFLLGWEWSPRVATGTLAAVHAVYQDGSICLDILQKAWSPIYNVAAILTSIQSLLSDPNPNSPANSEASKLYTEDRAEYIRRVQATVIESLAP